MKNTRLHATNKGYHIYGSKAWYTPRAIAEIEIETRNILQSK